MKRLLWLSLMILTLSAMTFATSVDATNATGTLTGSSTGLSLPGSTLIAIGITGGTTFYGNLGTVSFSTGALTSGNLTSGGTYAGGGSFVVTGNGTDRIPNGVIFSGSFDGPVTWAVISLSNGTQEYELVGAMSGTWFNGKSVVGATVELAVNTGGGLFNGSANISSGNMNFQGNGLSLRSVTTPEPATLTLIGTGLLAIGALRRKKA